MRAFTGPMHELNRYDWFCSRLLEGRGKGMYLATGCVDAEKAHFIYSCGEQLPKKLILTFSDSRAREIYEGYSFFDPDICLFPSRDLIFFEADIRGNELVKERMKVFQSLLEKRSATVVATFSACMDILFPLEKIGDSILVIDEETEMEPKSLAKMVSELGYKKTVTVEQPGQFAVRGGIVDIFPITDELPVRIEFFDVVVDRINRFNPETQISIEGLLDEVRIYPANEMFATDAEIRKAITLLEGEGNKKEAQLRKMMKTEDAFRVKQLVNDWREKALTFQEREGLENLIGYLDTEKVSFLDYFSPKDTLVVIDEPVRSTEQGKAVELEFRESMASRLEKGYTLPGLTKNLFSFKETAARAEKFSLLGICSLERAGSDWDIQGHLSVATQTINSYQNNMELLIKDLLRWKKEKFRTILVCPSETRAKRLAEDFREREISAYYTEDLDHVPMPGELMLVRGKVLKGFEYTYLRFAIISESDLLGRSRKKKKTASSSRDAVLTFQDLKPGDYVIHEQFGLGVYKGIVKRESDSATKDYMKIQYDGNGCVFIPATSLNAIQKYTEVSSGGKPPKLNKIGTSDWTKTKAKVKKSVEVIAKDLVELYAARSRQKGFAYSPDTDWQREFEEMFPYEETEDQLKAIEETKRDMESDRCMDRLICGDVGFGKTEVAIRAAFKAVQDGKQVAFLVPTTILAQQHYNNLVQRLQDFPVRVDLMCRFVSKKEQTHTLTDLKKGLVDIVIGTHRLLSKDVEYKNLGLLIVDEEQRFGVTHKEKLKKIKENVDVLTLSATPIPRTLHMSLIGIREMSLLEEAPMDRVPIQTYVLEYNEEMIREAINRELARSGQVYYVYNRVDSIMDMANRIAALVPNARVAYAHGRMTGSEMEKIMYSFINGEIDVLVSTTIIETGLDISNVNTIIVHNADKMGLSQLYQLRGRVGRSNRTAFAFLMYRRNKILEEVAEKRLSALREFTELGSGFKVSMRDLEIRGAGNLLGESQSGHMEAIGYELYCKMLNNAVLKQKGITDMESFETMVDLNLDAYIPGSYIPNEVQKLDIYRRIAVLENEAEGEALLEEMVDRFSDPPKEVQELVRVALFKARAHRCYIEEIRQVDDVAYLKFCAGAKLDISKLPELFNLYRGKLVMAPKRNDTLALRLQNTSGKPVMEEIAQTIDRIESICCKKKD